MPLLPPLLDSSLLECIRVATRTRLVQTLLLPHVLRAIRPVPTRLAAVAMASESMRGVRSEGAREERVEEREAGEGCPRSKSHRSR